MNVDKAIQTQLANIQKKIGKTLDQLYAWLKKSGLAKHGELRDAAKSGLGLGHGDANMLVTLFRRSTGAASAPPATADAALDLIYSGPRAALRPIHARVMKAIDKLGPFEIAPKKTYLSLRRKKQFAMVGPATKTQVEIGLNAENLEGGERLIVQKPGGMCQYKVRLAATSEVDGELTAWIRAAYDGAGGVGNRFSAPCVDRTFQCLGTSLRGPAAASEPFRWSETRVNASAEVAEVYGQPLEENFRRTRSRLPAGATSA